MIKRPILALSINDLSELQFPLLLSPKYDGIRCVIVDNKVMSRSLSVIRNVFIAEKLKDAPNYLDGELIIPNTTFNEIQSLIMSADTTPENFKFFVFDYVQNPELSFEDRINQLKGLEFIKTNPYVELIPQHLVNSPEEVLNLEKKYLDQGYEGVMLRSPSSLYKYGRSTLKEQALLKLKRFSDSEAKILKLQALEKNTNTFKVSNLGLIKRLKRKETQVKQESLGKMVVQDIYTGVTFSIGTGEGFTDDLRKHMWKNPEQYINKIIKYKYQPTGQKHKPRFPSFVGFRDESDL